MTRSAPTAASATPTIRDRAKPVSIRNRIFLVFALTIVLGVSGLLYWLRADMLPRYMEAQEDILVDLAQVLAADIETRGLKDTDSGITPDPLWLLQTFNAVQARRFEAQVYGLFKTRVDLRVYVTNARGTVIFDSDGGRDVGADYAVWRDVRLTLAGEYGARSTPGDPLFADGSTMYVAAPIRYQDDIVGVVSVGKPTLNVGRFLDAALRRASIAALVAIAAALLVALVLYRWVSQPLARLHDYARRLRSGQRLAPPALGNNEMGRVGEAMAALRQALDGKTYIEHYVQSLAHELKSPTAAIAGAAELLAEPMPEADRARFIRNIRHEAERLADLVERMLSLAAIENQQSLHDPQPVDLHAVIEEVRESLRPLAHARGLTLRLAQAADATVTGDRFLIMRALTNVLANAIDHSPDNSTIDIRLNPTPADVTVDTRDLGDGIPDYAKPRVFDRFYSLPRTDGRKGTGLGLSFVQQIMALHGGEVRVADAPPRGTLVSLRFPRQ